MDSPAGWQDQTLETVLVFEYVTGGGMVDHDLPQSWAAEGLAMRRAIVEAFAQFRRLRVVTTSDHRLCVEAPPGVDVVVNFQGESLLGSLVTQADYTLLIAPEADGILSRLTRVVEDAGGRLLGSGRAAVDLTADKARLADFFLAREIPTPPTLMLEARGIGPPVSWGDRVVVKPRWGAGSVDTVVLPAESVRRWQGPDRAFVAQPYLPGEPMSASFLVDAEGFPILLGVGLQRIAVDEAGRISYQGGMILAGSVDCPQAVRDAVLAVVRFLPGPSLRGFVGVDYLLDEQGRATVLEINPRPTTSFVGLAQLIWPGILAPAWIAANRRGLASTAMPDLLREGRRPGRISFDADGTILDGSGDKLP